MSRNNRPSWRWRSTEYMAASSVSGRKPATAAGMRCFSTTNSQSSGPITVETWPGAINASNPGVPESSNIATAGQVSRPDNSTSRLSGAPSASIAATGAVVVSNPAAKNTTWRDGSSLAMRTASVGDAIGRMSPPAARACSRERGSLFGTLTGTRSMSPNATSVTSSLSASCIASNTSSSGQMHTGHPGPGTSSMLSGIAVRRPAIDIARSWPPHTFIMRTGCSRPSPFNASSQYSAECITLPRSLPFRATAASCRARRRSLTTTRTGVPNSPGCAGSLQHVRG